MATQLYVPGPVEIWVGTGSVGAYQYLGYTEDEADIQFRAAYRDVMADFGGDQVPIDVQWMGEQAYISMRLAYFDEAILNSVVGRIPNQTPGTATAQSVGSLMTTEGYAYTLFLYSPYGTKTAYSTMNKGWVFSKTFLSDDYGLRLGIRNKTPQVTFRALPSWTPSTLSYVLYSNTLPSPLPSVT